MPAGRDHFAAGNGFRRADAREIRLLGEALRPRRGARALDVGCGLGTYAATPAGLGIRTPSGAAVAAANAFMTDRLPSPSACVHC